jgi:hypothetical protein
MKEETRALIEQAFNSLHEASQDENNQMTEAGMLMYGLCMAIIDIDDKLKENDGLTFI